MPRQKRLLSPTHIYHVMVRGNSGRDIFLDDEDRKRLLRIIETKKKEEGFILFAYCLMNNHFHLLLKENRDNISQIMKKINTSYALYFNKKYQLSGHLFQNRFRSEVVESDSYLLAIVRYIHNNPVKSGLVSFPQDYSWSSYLNYINHQGRLVDTNQVLGIFSEDISQAYIQFIEFSKEFEQRHHFMEYKEQNQHRKEINDYSKVRYFVNKFLKKHQITLNSLSDRKNKAIRDKLVQELKDKSVYSYREIAKFLNMGRGMVQKAGKK
jgi:REP element-mobilizing transposase RayT